MLKNIIIISFFFCIISCSSISIRKLASTTDLNCSELLSEFSLVDNYRNLHPDDIPQSLIRAGEYLNPSHLSYTELMPLNSRSIEPIELVLKNEDPENFIPLKGDTLPNKVTLNEDTKAVWKPHKEIRGSNYRAEVLAYEIDQILSFNLVPPTIARDVNGEIGSIQLYIQPTDIERFPPSFEDLRKQSLFDFIIDNRDRHPDNYLVSLATGKLISIDNGTSFGIKGYNLRNFKDRENEINLFLKSPEGSMVIEKMMNLNLARFKIEVANYIGSHEADRLIHRINFIINHYNRTISFQ